MLGLKLIRPKIITKILKIITSAIVAQIFCPLMIQDLNDFPSIGARRHWCQEYAKGSQFTILKCEGQGSTIEVSWETIQWQHAACSKLNGKQAWALYFVRTRRPYYQLATPATYSLTPTFQFSLSLCHIVTTVLFGNQPPHRPPLPTTKGAK